MEFEEQFPSLKGAKVVVKELVEINSTEAYDYSRDKYFFIPTFAVEKHCLDNQRVKEAIQKLKKSICLNPDYGKVPEIYAKNKLAVDVLETLEIELGLEVE